MSSVGVFRKEETDGKPFLVYTLTQTDNPTFSAEALAMDSSGDNLPLQPLFLCPRARNKLQMLKGMEADEVFQPFNISPHFPSTRSGDHECIALLDCDHDGICKLPVVPLFWCNNKDPNEFHCGACQSTMHSRSYFACLQCQRNFHKECVEAPLEIKYPSHPFHSLRLYRYTTYAGCMCCKIPILDKFYNCTTCEFRMLPVCAMKPISFVVDHPKSHPHPLTFFPTQASLVCHFCALINKLDPTYICIDCVFVIHKGCIGFPRVIRISRHPHRISFTSSLPSRMLSCGVCRQQVDNNYGAYSCNKCDAYFVHSKCALNPKVWDGKDLEGVPEEDDIIDDGEPFKRVADGIILHPFHSHHLRLEIGKAYDGNKYCRGCALPIYEGQFYSCMECDFILHEICANAPRMKRYPFYPHPLTLKDATMRHDSERGVFHCRECWRDGNGFFYEHRKGKEIFQLDLRCASISEPFEYQSHEHPLFQAWNLPEETQCTMCKMKSGSSKLICMECDYLICFCCATFPYKARYKHESHFLTICDGKEANDQIDWCEICEGKIEEVKERGYHRHRKAELRFYRCNDCGTALHIGCLFGVDMYIKPGSTKEEYISVRNYLTKSHELRLESKSVTYHDLEEELIDVQVLFNSSLSRPICSGCMRRCPFPIFFKGYNTILCSWDCIGTLTEEKFSI